MTLKLSQVGKANFSENNEVYFTLDWESTSKNRKGYTHGYQMIKDTGRHLLLHINCLEHLNFLMGVEKAGGYPELKETYQQLSDEDKKYFRDAL